MPTAEETDALIAHVHAMNKKVRDELLAKWRAELEKTKDSWQREWIQKEIDGILEIGRGEYDD
jgi:hypothetical protein